MSDRLWRAIVASVCSLAFAACSEATSPGIATDSFTPLTHVSLAITATDAPHGRVLRFPANVADWQARGGEVEILAGDPARRTNERMTLRAASDLTFVIPGPIELALFESLALRVIESRPSVKEVALVFRRGGEQARVATTVSVSTGSGARLFRVALPVSTPSWAHVDSLELQLSGDLAAGASIEEPVLEWSPPAEWRKALAQSDAGTFDLQLGGERRVVRCLDPGSIARGSLRGAAAGARVSFGFGSLDARLGNPGRAQVLVRVKATSGTTSEASFPLSKPDAWFEAEVALPAGAVDAEIEIELVLKKSGWLAVALEEPRVISPRDDAPCVLLVTSDTHRGDHVGAAHAGVEIETRALDELATRGLLFTNCFSTSNVTLPSHVALLTGAHPRDSGITDNNTELHPDAPTLAEVFHDAGWRTFAVTSVNLLSADFGGVGQGFARMSSPLKRRSASEAVALAQQWLADARGEPAFAWVHVFDAHAPYEPPTELARKYYDVARDPFDPSLEPETWRPPAWLDNVRDPDYVRALYKSEIDGLDAALGALFAEPRVRAGVVAVTGDHGEVLGLHGIWWEHKSLYPDTLHVPLIVCAPGLEHGARSTAPVTNLDLGRTLLDFARLAGREFPGRNLLHALDANGGEVAPRFALAGNRQSAAISRGAWHLMLHLHELTEGRRTGREKHQVELYDLDSDPRCERDLVDVQPAKARELRAELASWLAESDGGAWAGDVHKDSATVRNLAALGYAAGDGPSSSEISLDPQCVCVWCLRWR